MRWLHRLTEWAEAHAYVATRAMQPPAGSPAAALAPGDVLATAAAWQPLVGNRLEYRDTGFAVELRTDPAVPPYWLFDPDGRTMAFGYDLDGMKQMAEKHAAWRAQFSVRGTP